jgi:hypothetical protein
MSLRGVVWLAIIAAAVAFWSAVAVLIVRLII